MRLFRRRPAPEPSARAVRDDYLPRMSRNDLLSPAERRDEVRSRLLDRSELGPLWNGTRCWLWTGATRLGYAELSYEGTNRSGHRLAYELWRGPIPEGLQIDHLCRNRRCINPWHLEPVTSAVNIGRSPRALATHCKYGHEFTPENTRRADGRRYCRTCAAARLYARRNGLDFETVARSRRPGMDLRRTAS